MQKLFLKVVSYFRILTYKCAINALLIYKVVSDIKSLHSLYKY